MVNYKKHQHQNSTIFMQMRMMILCKIYNKDKCKDKDK